MSEKNSCVLKAAVMVLVAALVVCLSSVIAAESSGQWVPSAATSGCPSTALTAGCEVDTVCSDWDVDGIAMLDCCIEPQYVGTSVLAACGQL